MLKISPDTALVCSSSNCRALVTSLYPIELHIWLLTVGRLGVCANLYSKLTRQAGGKCLVALVFASACFPHSYFLTSFFTSIWVCKCERERREGVWECSRSRNLPWNYMAEGGNPVASGLRQMVCWPPSPTELHEIHCLRQAERLMMAHVHGTGTNCMLMTYYATPYRTLYTWGKLQISGITLNFVWSKVEGA